MNEKKLTDLYKKQLAHSAEKAPEGLWEDIAGKMDENQLISAYKEQMAASSEKAPDGLWDDIAGKMNEDQLISAYKLQLAQSVEKAPGAIWIDMARKMDIDEVWEGVATGLNEEKRKRGFWWINGRIAAAIAFLVISTLSVWFVRNLSSPEGEFALIQTELPAPAQEDKTEESTEAPARQPEFTIAITGGIAEDETMQETEKTAIAALEEQNVSSREGSNNPSDLPENTLAYGTAALSPLNTATAFLTIVDRPSLQEMPSYSYLEEKREYNLGLIETDAGTSVLALGFTTAMKNTWLFNHETFQGFNSGSGSTTRMQIYPDVAVNLRYLLSERWKMESSLSFSSSAGQSYEQYIYGRFSQREIALNYFHAELLAGYNHRKRWVIRSNAISHSTSMGIYYGVLNGANESIAGKKEDISMLYRKNDFGIVTGHNLNIPIFGNLLFSPGIHITWGLPNIYQGQHTLPSLKRTHNRSVELRFSLYYNFSR